MNGSFPGTPPAEPSSSSGDGFSRTNSAGGIERPGKGLGAGGAVFLLAALTALAPVPSALAAERIGDVLVAPQFLVPGETWHGYREIRVLLQNESPTAQHRVTLVFPDRSYTYGNCLSRVSRTVMLNPASRIVVPLWLPPLPANGNGLLRVEVDDEDPRQVSLSGGAGHVPRYGMHHGSMPYPATVLVSRGLNFDDLQRGLQAGHVMFTALEASGPPDTGGRHGVTTGVWMPDHSLSGPHWIELRYDRPIVAERVRIHETLGALPHGEIILTGISGTNLGRIAFTSAPGARPRRAAGSQEYAFSPTPEPVRSVRLQFSGAYGGAICIDAVELESPGGTNQAWASSALASSEAGPSSMPGGPGSQRHSLLRAEGPVTEWSEYWLSYTPFDAIALTAGDLKSMPAAVQEAVWRYAESGGILIVLGALDPPRPWRLMPGSGLENARQFVTGFGLCYVVPEDKVSAMAPAVLKALGETLQAAARYWDSLPTEDTANSGFPVIENSQIPIRGTVLVMLAFVIAIGPVNLIVLSRLNRRTWLLWTIPAISALTCLAVFAYSLLREGVTPDVRTEGLTLLDQVNRRAASVGLTAFYCPLTPSGGVRFDFETEATPLVESWSHGPGSAREVDWTQSQQLRRGWVLARVPAHFHLRKSDTRRERLQLETSNGQLHAVNGLGASIRALWLADASGKVHQAENIPAGRKAKLTPSGDTAVGAGRGPRAFFESVGSTPASASLPGAAVSSLLPGTYIAELEANPFLENALGARDRSARSRERAVVYGILDSMESSGGEAGD